MRSRKLKNVVGLQCSTLEQKEEIWESKALHWRHIKHVRQDHISKKMSYQFLQSGQVFPETDSFILTIQDQVIATKNYQKFIIKDGSVKDD
ncbi:unnamed protein product [Bemisia tabaci]|uniref:Uncharacterized protein n=1 Tax=Bemisia tabaci TaxID=7038 RepID=A0A9P0A184_BEMTA|nr:unnamed protein product [Bemisia tabaci]